MQNNPFGCKRTRSLLKKEKREKQAALAAVLRNSFLCSVFPSQDAVYSSENAH
jgi:hypothetical protein